MVKNSWDVRIELESDLPETVLCEYVEEEVDWYAVYANSVPNRLVVAAIDFHAKALART